jgi:uncharacterized protein YwqG
MSFDATELRAFDAILSAHRVRAILLHRPYPPDKFPAVRSKLGGLPALPPGIEWPRGRNPQGHDVPLHFLAQIDCAELPRGAEPLPTEGMLFFFARDDEEQIWGEKNAHHHARVIYAPAVPDGQAARAAPLDLRPIKDRVAKVSYKPEWILPDEAGPAVHFSWPIVALRFDTWPDASAFRTELGDGYRRRVEALRTGSFVAATGLPSRSQNTPDWDQHFGAPFSLPADRHHNTRFPQVGIMIDRLSRRVIRAHQNRNAPADRAAEIRVEASRWIERAAAIGLDAAPSDEDVEAFQRWLSELANEPSYLRRAMAAILTAALLDSITYAASAPEAAALIPQHYYDVLENHHIPIDQRKGREGDWQLITRVHQMFGYAPASQGSAPLDSGPVCLLQLATDNGLEFMFGDVGEATFWIKPKDLAAKRFDKAWATLAGH